VLVIMSVWSRFSFRGLRWWKH